VKKKYENIHEETKKELEEDLKTAIIRDCRKEMIEEGFYKYEVQIQNIRFVTYMSEDEVELSARLAIDILEELKNINNSGFDRERLNEMQKNAEAEKNELLSNILIWNKLCSERLLQIIDEIDVPQIEKTKVDKMTLKDRYPEELINMFSEALIQMDKNTVQYMIEEQQKELEEQQKELEEQQRELEEQQRELEEKNSQIRERDILIKDQAARIAELEAALRQK